MTSELVDQPTATPTRKVTAATLAAAVVSIVIYAASAAGVDLVPIAGPLVVLATGAAGYLVKERAESTDAA